MRKRELVIQNRSKRQTIIYVQTSFDEFHALRGQKLQKQQLLAILIQLS